MKEDMNSIYSRDKSLLSGMSFADLLLEIDCNLSEITEETVTEHFNQRLQEKVGEARAYFTANKSGIVEYAKAQREE